MILNNTLNKSRTPKVSVVAISYNQEKFIEQALKSFLMQKTDFDFEIVIADDQSTDNTPNIISQYARDFPDIVKPILRSENVGIQPNLIDALKHAKGDYIALCEGDDYWTDPLKLQKQYDFLSNNPDYSLIFHQVKVFYENNEKKPEVYPKLKNTSKITTEDLLRQNFIQTNSVMYRRVTYENIPKDILPLDWYLHLYHAKEGKIGFIHDVMSAYRRHSGGVWWDSYRNIDKIWAKHGVAHYSMYCEISKLFKDEPKYQNIIRSHIYRTLGLLIDADRKFHTRLIDQVLDKYPNVIDPLTATLTRNILEFEALVKHKDDQIALVESLLSKTGHELDEIKMSQSWLIVLRLRRIKSVINKIFRF